MTISPPHETLIATWDHPPAVATRGTVIVVAGRGEHAGVYHRFGTRIAVDGYRVHALGDPTVDPAGVEDHLQALLTESAPVHPVVLVGSDAGALFAAGLVAAGRVDADGLILVGLPTVVPGSEPADWDAELAERTACPTHQNTLRADALVRHGTLAEELPTEWYAAAELTKVRVPILGLHGAADTISPLAGVRTQFAAAPNAELVSIAGGKHDALNDATHRTAAATVVLFLERLRLGAEAPAIAHREL
ncbi:alpha/beta hydrolase [Cryptosporangium aurantiacum]|uniref:Lysophospholipase, alpha-beta hydrolase superfamily n=1 Tax=Cryptosporangium aurantiacum TaxID=134849 RepID=A0A1M7KE43_9ACTN|nr:lysophospholipase [Cryptosporangium aurantiacum]SHM63546.1 Lysophospholipase, alpha-beta hydrolase superfamily [Cryptosporangium aurantiacum]